MARGVPAQIHYALDDALRNQRGSFAVAEQVRAAPAALGLFDYDGSGHPFTDPRRPRSTAPRPPIYFGSA
ncbi:MAG: hypothetical protein AVDCRST_MAG45-2539 [uncultured Solirubrobacterales bacterium]|uniref:Uncharacterized protein n=1 Tax=uncultured Solirubrobacterales bacterium TaxID=768556 RepID=A0A6J4TEY0_9ACTN|nr:MAG: hypothetical protein AVDCRST_MAG45-2539 [uncultured Solirubrobacterales bacterium]